MFVLEVELAETMVERSVRFELDTCSAPTARLQSSGSFFLALAQDVSPALLTRDHGERGVS